VVRAQTSGACSFSHRIRGRMSLAVMVAPRRRNCSPGPIASASAAAWGAALVSSQLSMGISGSPPGPTGTRLNIWAVTLTAPTCPALTPGRSSRARQAAPSRP
jgi:hypothetical protein